LRRIVRRVCLPVFCLAILALAATIAIDRLAEPGWGYPVPGTGRLPIHGSIQIAQAFTAPWRGLSGIQVALAQEGEPASCTAVIRLQDALNTREDLWAQEFVLRDLAAGALYRFDFPALRESAGRRYYVALEAPSCTTGRSPSAVWDAGGAPEGSAAYQDGRPIPGALQFQTFYTLTAWDKADLLLTRMAAGRPYLLGRKGLYAGLFVAWAVVLVLFVVQTADRLAPPFSHPSQESGVRPDQRPPEACVQSEEQRR
jgi:hypothetical protein